MSRLYSISTITWNIASIEGLASKVRFSSTPPANADDIVAPAHMSPLQVENIVMLTDDEYSTDTSSSSMFGDDQSSRATSEEVRPGLMESIEMDLFNKSEVEYDSRLIKSDFL